MPGVETRGFRRFPDDSVKNEMFEKMRSHRDSSLGVVVPKTVDFGDETNSITEDEGMESEEDEGRFTSMHVSTYSFFSIFYFELFFSIS